MSNVHFIMNPKGGIGKSWVAALLAQYLKSKEIKISCADTDPKTPTFTKFKSLNVARIEIYENEKIKQAKFDSLIESMIVKKDFDFVIDTGGNTYIDLMSYFRDNSTLSTLNDFDIKVFIHCPLVGAQAYQETLNGFVDILKMKSDFFKVVVWENEFWGLVESNGDKAIESDLYLDAVESGKVLGSVKIKDRSDSDSFIDDIKKMTTKSLTLDDVQKSTDFQLVSKIRLKTVINDVYLELDKIVF